VPRVELTAAAVADLERLIRTQSLPTDTKRRVKRSLVPLRRVPRLGPELTGRWQAFRFLLGPWRWLVIVYVFIEDDDRVVVVTIQDARSSSAATAARSGGTQTPRVRRRTETSKRSPAGRPASKTSSSPARFRSRGGIRERSIPL